MSVMQLMPESASSCLRMCSREHWSVLNLLKTRETQMTFGETAEPCLGLVQGSGGSRGSLGPS